MRSNAIPPAIPAEFEDLLSASGRRVLAGVHPLCGALANPRIRFLARDARWMTGQVMYVDGGFLAAGLTMAPGDETKISLER